MVLVLVASDATPRQTELHSFKKITLSQQFWAEGATFGDFNRDGKMDVVSGPYWWEGPALKKRHEYAPTTQTFVVTKPDGKQETIPGFEGGLGTKNAYSDNFFAFARDFNADGWSDILVIGFPGKETFWFENPKGKSGAWVRHLALQSTDNESPTFTDLTGDGKPELVCLTQGAYGYATPDAKDPNSPWRFHPVSAPNKDYQRFTHGLGVGDVNGDGRMDLLEKDGWWEQPASLQGDPIWTKHAFPFSQKGGSQMYAYDINGDGRNDVVSVIEAHGFGLSWFENVVSADKDNPITFIPHIIIGEKVSDNRYGLRITQMHAVDLWDMDGDGVKDIVTGKRFWAHGPGGDASADPGAPAVVYWLRVVRQPDKSVDFVPHQIDADSGVGTQVFVGDFNKDRMPDVVVGNKKGVFVFVHSKKKVNPAAWIAAQPKPVSAP